jgi:acyl-CoA reductase-like NAD-dependent aldehyde dehydrogenase
MLLHRPEDAAKITNTLIAHPYVRKINFCGSSAVGSIIAATAGKYLKPLVLELGGKGCAIVLKDADIKKAAAACALGAFTNVRCPNTSKQNSLIEQI